jgi:hypothetical protein
MAARMTTPENPFAVQPPPDVAAQADAAQGPAVTNAAAAQAPDVTNANAILGGPAAQAETQQAARTRQGVATSATGQVATVDPETQTVQRQLAGILASGSPLLVQAQTRAAQDANRRGLLNSSMATSAGEDSLYRTALPIASQDAETYGKFALSNADRAQQAELTNANAKNQMEQLNVGEEGNTNRFNVGEANTSGRFNAGETNQTARLNTETQNRAILANAGEANQSARQGSAQEQQTALANAGETNQAARQTSAQQQQANLANMDAQNKLLLQNIDARTRVDLVNIEANYRTLMQSSQSAGDLYQQMLKNISDITMNKDLDKDAKDVAIAQQKTYLQQGMALIGNMNNLNMDLNFAPAAPPGGVDQTPVSGGGGSVTLPGGRVVKPWG